METEKKRENKEDDLQSKVNNIIIRAERKQSKRTYRRCVSTVELKLNSKQGLAFFTGTMDQLNRWTVSAGAANTLASAIMLIS